MKAFKVLIVIFVIVSLCVIIPIALGFEQRYNDNASIADAEGTYYAWIDEALNKDVFIRINADYTAEITAYEKTIPFKIKLTEHGHRFSPTATDEKNQESLPDFCGVRDGIIRFPFILSSPTDESDETDEDAEVVTVKYFCQEGISSPIKKSDNLYYSVGIDGYYAITGVVNTQFVFLTIPRMIDHVPVRRIERSTLWGCSYLETILFNGSKEQWNDIYKESGWDYGAGYYVIQCSNGDIK